ncbi:MAG TPA: GrpB family protein, partial [Gemmatimonadaceae bacterium]|nr:GrpB family protein [Gemmatimonadaceae bacterium]
MEYYIFAGSPPHGVRLAEYNPAWPAAFSLECTRIRAALGDLTAEIEHVGSTSVPGLIAKPVIDMLVGRPADSDAAPYIDALQSLEYEYRGESGIPGRHYFRRGRPHTHHLHLVEHGGTLWWDHLRFRDRLRADSALVTEYA